MRETIENLMFRRVFLGLLALAALGLGEASAQRYSRGPYDSQQVVPLERMLPQIRRSYPGTFYDAEGPYPDEMGNPHYHIKWLTPDGRVIWLDTDARSGRVMGVNGSGWRNQWRGQRNYPQGYPGGGYPGGAPRYAPPRQAFPQPAWGHGGPPRGGWNNGDHWNGGHRRGH